MKKFFIIVFGLAVLIFIAALAYYFLWPKGGGEVSLEFSKPDTVPIGQPFVLEVSMQNSGGKPLKSAKLSLSIPDGMAFVGKPADARFMEQPIGDMGAGVLAKQTFSLIATGGAESVKRLTARVTYLAGPNTGVQFESSGDVDVSVGEPSINLNFDIPDKIFSGQNFDLKITYENTSDADFDLLKFKMDYPPIFQFAKSKPDPSRSNNFWELGPLKHGEKGTLVISGSVLGSDQLYFQFRGTLSAELEGQLYPVANQEANLTIGNSPLSLSVKVNNGGSDLVLKPGDSVNYILTYKNNSNISLENATINAILTGEMFDFSRAKTNGSFNSINNSFVWNAGNVPQLQHVEPGETGSVSVSLAVRPDFPLRRVSDKNFTLRVKAQAESPTVPDAHVGKTVAVTMLENKIAGRTTLASKAYYHDVGSGIVNIGLFPPRANQPTQYTVHWIIANYATDVANVRVSASLLSNTRFTGVVKSTIGSAPKYNPASGEITWEIANLPATKGVLGGPVEATFQIENTPAINQVGKSVPLVSPVRLEADDTFAGGKLTDSAGAVTTDLPDDTSLGGNRQVTP